MAIELTFLATSTASLTNSLNLIKNIITNLEISLSNPKPKYTQSYKQSFFHLSKILTSLSFMEHVVWTPHARKTFNTSYLHLYQLVLTEHIARPPLARKAFDTRDPIYGSTNHLHICQTYQFHTPYHLSCQLHNTVITFLIITSVFLIITTLHH